MASANEKLASMVASRRDSGRGRGTGDGDDSWPCLLMRVGTRWCALRAASVREVIAVDTITRVPSQSPHLLGVMLVHGRLVPVIGLCQLLGNPDMALENPPGRRLVVVDRADVEIGLVADDAQGVVYLPVARMVARGEPGGGLIIGEVTWNDHLVSLFDEDRLLDAALAAGPA